MQKALYFYIENSFKINGEQRMKMSKKGEYVDLKILKEK